MTREFTLSAAQEIGNGEVRAIYVWRKATGLVESFIDDATAAGKTTVVQNGTTFGVFDNVYYRNSDDVVRNYQALETMGNYRLRSNWSVAGHWTLQLKNDGNFEGEAANQPGVGSRCSVTIRRCSSRIATSRWAVSTTTSSTRCACGRSISWASAASARSTSRRCGATTRR